MLNISNNLLTTVLKVKDKCYMVMGCKCKLFTLLVGGLPSIKSMALHTTSLGKGQNSKFQVKFECTTLLHHPKVEKSLSRLSVASFDLFHKLLFE